MAPPPVRRAFDRVRHGAAPLGAAGLGAARLGVKCGHNGAFVVRVIARDGELAAVQDESGHRAWIEHDLLRPLVRGDTVTPWSVGRDDAAIIWTHAEHGGPLAELPPYAARWFARRRRDLETRTDAHRAARWWSLFRTEAARVDTPRVVWCDMGRAPRAAFLAAGDATVPLNTCYAMRCKEEMDALALVALLNSPLTAAWLSIVAEPARGGYRRYLGWTVSLLPMPRPWHRARGSLAALTTAALRGEPPEPRHVLDVTCSAFGVRSREMQALLAWSRR
jgi:hypothetical protein